MRKHDGRAAAIRAGLRTVTPLSALLLLPSPGEAAETLFPVTLTTPRIVTLVVVLGVVGFAIISAITLNRARQRAENENETLRAGIADLKAAAERRRGAAADDDQRLVAWEARRARRRSLPGRCRRSPARRRTAPPSSPSAPGSSRNRPAASIASIDAAPRDAARPSP